MKQAFRIFQQPLRRGFKAGFQRGTQVQHQAAPLDPVPRRAAVGAEAVSRVIDVVIADRVPAGVEMLVNAVLPFARHVVNNHRGDAQGAVEPFTVVGHVINDQEGFHGVHVGVTAAVIFRFAEGFVPGLQAHLLLFAPEVALNHLDGIVQQLACLRVAGGDGARRAQQDEEVLIALLGRINHAFIVYAGVPAAVLFIAQRTVQGINAVLNQRVRAGAPHVRRHRVNVQHAGGDPQMGAHIAAHLPVIAQPAKAGRYGGVFTEIENAVGLLFEPAVMAQGVKPFHVRVLS